MSTPKTLTITETLQLLDTILKKDCRPASFKKSIRNYTITLLMLDAGLRVGEVAQLRVTDLLYMNRPVESLVIRAEISKNKRERIIPMSARLQEAITTLSQTFWNDRDKLGVYNAAYEYVPAWTISTRQIERFIRKAASKSIGRPIHPHVLRHTFGTRIERKAGIRVAQELLGHTNIASTQIYTHPNSDDKRAAIDALQEKPL